MNFGSKIVLVTGGAGSLGRRLTQRLLTLDNPPLAIRILDNNENGLAQLQLILEQYKQKSVVRYFLGDIRDRNRIMRAIENVDICIHCAAAKRIELCETNPFESLQINVIGTQNCIDAALEANIDKFLFVSSDKATQAISTYGRCKALSESLTIDANNYKGDRRTKFSVVRPPNYIDSDGSVFEIWKYQKEHGLPITVTSELMTRYFMNFDDIIKFIMKSLDMMEGREIFVPSGAEKVRIIDLARKYSDNIKIIGMRKGERLEETLIDPAEIAHAELKEGIWVIDHD